MYVPKIQESVVMAEASTVGLHFCKLKSLPLTFYVSFLEQHNSFRSCNNIVLRGTNSKSAQPEPQPLPSEPKPQPVPQPLPSEPEQTPWWRNWTLGAFLSVGLPFITNKMNSVVKIRSEFETKLQETEDMVEEIQRGATVIEKRAEKRLKEYLKDDEGIPRRVVVYIESAAERIAKTACSVDHVIDMVQDIFLLESPDNDQARKMYSAEEDKKETVVEVEKEEKDQTENSMEVDKELEDQTKKAMEDDNEVKDREEKTIQDLEVGRGEKDHEPKTTQQ